MSDITLCTKTMCPMGKYCYRRMAEPHVCWQKYDEFHNCNKVTNYPDCIFKMTGKVNKDKYRWNMTREQYEKRKAYNLTYKKMLREKKKEEKGNGMDK